MSTPEIAFAREVGRGLPEDALPGYAPMLAAYHRAHAGRLAGIIADLGLAPGSSVLDMACGDGSYTLHLAAHVGEAGRVVGADIAPAYLRQARAAAAASPYGGRVRFEEAAIEGLPFAEGSFDLVWCAQSLYSLPDPVAALHAMARVTRSGGTVAVLENDSLHQILLPWPAELELALRQAQLRSLQAEGTPGAKPFIGRQLLAAFVMVGLEACTVTPYAATRQAPLDADERAFLAGYLDDLCRRAWPHLDEAAREGCRLLLSPESEMYLLDQPGCSVTYLDLVARGRRP